MRIGPYRNDKAEDLISKPTRVSVIYQVGPLIGHLSHATHWAFLKCLYDQSASVTITIRSRTSGTT